MESACDMPPAQSSLEQPQFPELRETLESLWRVRKTHSVQFGDNIMSTDDSSRFCS